MARAFGIGLVGIVIVAGVGVFGIAPGWIDGSLNRVEEHAPHPVSERAAALHASLRLADLHADSLLWSRDLLDRNRRGQVDLPRLQEGGFALQVFAAVTKTPAGQNYERNEAGSDQITLLAVSQRWPPRTWTSLYERARHQVERLADAAARSQGALRMVRTRADLESALARHARDREGVAGIMAAEGAHPLEGRIQHLDGLFEAGFRVLGLQHFFDNELGGSLHGISGEGLTPFGRAVGERADDLSMVLDLAHSSERVVEDVLALTRRPVIVSHTGLAGACDSPRNISDPLMKRIAAAGGLVGIGYWEGAVCDPSPEGVARSVRYGVELLGEDHVALGSDFDGAVTTRFDASEAAALTHALLVAGLSEAQIRKVMGENAIRFFLAHLPSG